MSNQDWNGPQGHRPAGRGPRVGLIVGGTLVLVALIALAVFLATRAGTTADPSPTPALPATSAPATTAPSPWSPSPAPGRRQTPVRGPS
ncbi:hypothetical protein G7085_05380 [Tessaracoccus sp. HDW20]|uniref:hypothetical protein n=1 Tax=Tessaracoccus coleopterorum TaxID=2714950 RepID=UPI0018D28D82|nr:hypothetical protein [Tessaracoccus coleopterorum]NHB84247.1 hypothetical protein [Tessaracoccus coleopterorum]